MEIVLLEHKDSETLGQFPGLFLFTGNARMMRPVLNLAHGEIELIGTFEQVYLNVCLCPEEAIPEVNIWTYITLSSLHFDECQTDSR